MSDGTSSARVCAVIGTALVVLSGLERRAVVAQDLPLRTHDPGSATFECQAWAPATEPTRDDVGAAHEIASDANEALVLGDIERARELLAKALELDDRSTELRYRYARVLESLGARRESIQQLCRVLAARSESDEPTDAKARLDSLVAADREALPPNAVAAFTDGVETAQSGRLAAAAESFKAAAEAAPDWPAASYNLGVVLAKLGEHADGAESLRQYLALAPDAEDAVPVSHAVGRWEASATARSADARAALALGFVMPGMGQFYSGRSRTGLVVLGVAAGSVAAGFLVRQVTVRCLSASFPGACPQDQIVSRRLRRPHLGTSLALAGLVTAVGAIEAFIRSRSGAGTGEDEPSFVSARDGANEISEAPPSALGSRGTDVVFFSFDAP